MKITSLFKADRFIERQQAAGNECWWDGWKMVFFKPSRAAFYRKGIRHNGRFGFVTTVDVDQHGNWNIPPQVIV